MKKKALSLLLVLSMCLTLLPTAAFAQDTQEAAEQGQIEVVSGEQEETPAPEEPDEEEEPAPEEPEQEKEAQEEPATQAAADEIAVQAVDHTDHPICGDSTCEDTSPALPEGKSWVGVSSLDAITAAGYYYLTADVKLTSTWEPVDGVTLCLNGRSIAMSDTSNAVIKVNKDCTFTLCDCNSTESKHHFTNDAYSNGRWKLDDNGEITVDGGIITSTYVSGNGVSVSGGTFNMYGGTLCGNEGNPGSVNVSSGTFNMYGGAIRGNYATAGGGVCVSKEATFNMRGGIITENAVGGSQPQGGGVCVSGNFTVTGNVKITGNKDANDATNNVYLLARGKTIQIVGALDAEARIGVTSTEELSATVPVTVATLAEGATYNDGNIFSDLGDPSGVLLEDGENGKVVNLYSAIPHKHPICGSTCEDGTNHDEQTWEPISGLDEITGAGNYYLTNDVVLSRVWTNSYNVNLCLNGHSITLQSSAADADRVIQVDSDSGSNKTLSICDCNGSGNGKGIITGASAYGVQVPSTNAFNLYGGTITGNGYGVNSHGTFNMYGGVIKENSWHGVYNYGTFHMCGGSIINNNISRTTNGGGVYVYSGTFTVAGDVTITGNTVNGEKNNVYLPNNKTITVSGALGENAKIGVTTEKTVDEGNYVTVAKGKSGSPEYTLTEADLAHFESDAGYTPKLNGNTVIFANGTLHEHAVCGKTGCTEHTGHSDVVWLPLTSTDGKLYYSGVAVDSGKADNILYYTLPAGNYYLSGDVTIDGYIEIGDDVNLCLNGYTISTTAALTAGRQALIKSEHGKNLTICDCSKSGSGTINAANATNGILLTTGAFTMYGGTINAANAANAMNGVLTTGAFTMYGGKITGASTGVYVYTLSSTGTFNMYGGTIMGNEIGVGFYNEANKLTVGGSAKIENNNTKNVSLWGGYIIAIHSSLTNDARIGITTGTKPSESNPIKFATGATNTELNYKTIFSSDATDQNYVVTRSEDGTLSLGVHQHAWNYAYNGTITATCVADGCDLPGRSGGSLTFSASNASYDRNPKAATLKASDDWLGIAVADIQITYTGREGTDYNSTTAPANAGDYTASITLTGTGENSVTVSENYRIAKVAPTIAWNGYPWGKSFTGSEIAPPTKNDILIHDGNRNDLGLFDSTTFRWYEATADGKKGTLVTGETGAPANPIDAGNYIIEAVIKGTDNTEPATCELLMTIGKKENASVNGQPFTTVINVYPVDGERTYEYLLTDAVKDVVRPGGDLALIANQINYSNQVKSVVVEDGKVKITMNAVAQYPADASVGVVTVFVSSRNYNRIPLSFEMTVVEKTPEEITGITMTSWTYGEEPNEPGGYTVPEGVEATITYAVKNDDNTNGDFSTTVPTNAGNYTVKVTYETDDKIYTGTADFAISRKELTADDLQFVEGNYFTKTYDGTVNTGAVVVIKDSAKVNQDDELPSVAGTCVYNSANVAEANKVTFTSVEKSSANYILPAGLTVWHEASISQAELYPYECSGTATYGTKLRDITIQGTVKRRDTDAVVAGTWAWDTTDPDNNLDEMIPAGECRRVAVFTPEGDPNNYRIGGAAVNLTIDKATPTIQLQSKYLQAKNGVGYDISNYAGVKGVEGGTAPGALKYELAETYTGVSLVNNVLTVQPGATADSITVKVTAMATRDYKEAVRTFTVTLYDRPLNSYLKFDEATQTKTYGDGSFTIKVKNAYESTVTYSSDNEAVAKVNPTTGEVTIVGAGTAVIKATGSATDRFAETTVSYTLTVNKKQIAIPMEITTEFIYNGEDQTYNLAENDAYTITGNVQTNANETGYTVTVALKDTENTKWAGGSDDTVDKTYTFVIKRATVTITVLDKSAYVGDAEPDLSNPELDKDYTVKGLIGEDALTGTLTLTYESDPDMTKTGETAIKASGVNAGANYTIEWVDGKLTVTNRPSSGGGSTTYPVNVPSKTESGAVTVSTKNASKGSTVTITVKPEDGFKLADLTVTDKDGNELKLTNKGNGQYTFTMPAGKVEVKATFAKEAETSPFTDVSTDAYYYEAVKWAADQGITGGIGNGLFGPNQPCTRAQIVTFLWRAAGSPEPKNIISFSDVPADSYYAKAVAWAVENGITTGTGDGKFSPDAACTRAQSVTFLFRASEASANGTPAFSDVAANAYYAEAVKWATDNGITNGIGNGLFGSNNDCTRAQIVTFLWRLYAGK